MKNIFCLLIFMFFSYADVLKINEFTADVYSKNPANSTKKISLSLELIGSELNDNEAYVLDSLNIIITSFYAEDLLTSMGKEKFKNALMKYALKKHSVEIDTALILSLKVVEKLELEMIIQAIKSKNLCSNSGISTNQNNKKPNDIVISPNLNDINQRAIDLDSIESFKDFGEK